MSDHLTVAQLATYIKTLVQNDAILSEVRVAGEISNPVLAKSGHFYFALKDAEATISCVMWRFAVKQLMEIPREGDQVIVSGHIDFYAPRGQLQLVARALHPAGGIGEIYQRFEETKARLEAEGLFDPARKRPLPPFPRRIALITSDTGAALRDFLRILRQRWPLADVLLVPSLVQGAEAPAMLQAALYRLYKRNDIDVIVLTRGGGSIEDLWAFNDEGLARLIAEAPVPVVCGVGHETDFTIADFVADYRAPTPSAAAAAIVPDGFTLRQSIDATIERLGELLLRTLLTYRRNVERIEQRLQAQSPVRRLQQQRQALDDLEHRLQQAHHAHLQRQRLILEALSQQLEALNPNAVLARGYAIVADVEGHVVQSVRQVHPDLPLSVRVSDGSFPVVVVSQPHLLHSSPEL